MIENPELSIDYILSYKDFVAGRKLGERQNIFLLILYATFRYVTPVLTVLLVVLIVFSFFDGARETIPSLLPLVFLLGAISILIRASTRIAYSRLRLNKSGPVKMTFKADAREFSRQIHGMGELTWLWSATHSVVENRKVLLVVVRKSAFIIIPRNVLTEGQISQLKEFQLRKGTATC